MLEQRSVRGSDVVAGKADVREHAAILQVRLERDELKCRCGREDVAQLIE
jgi:hypothetical protein